MNTNIKSLGVILFTAAALITGCKKEELRPLNDNFKPLPVSPYTPKESVVWKINRLQLKGKTEADLSEKFADWTLSMHNNGTVTAQRKAELVKGTWSVKMDEETEWLILDFGSHDLFKYMNNYWKLAKLSMPYKYYEDNDDHDGITGNLLLEKI
jgi:hypothetical protein